MSDMSTEPVAEIIGMPCAGTRPHACHVWQMSYTGYCECPGLTELIDRES